jgi:carboxymethylenebutenolidase
VDNSDSVRAKSRGHACEAKAVGQLVELGVFDQKMQSGYFAEAADRSAPGIVVIQEWWGVQGQIKGICDRYAAAGYDAVAPDLYAGRAIPYHDMAAAAAEMDALDFRGVTDGIVRAAARLLGAGQRKIGITGYCLGGIVSILAATRLDEFTASVCYYGIPPADLVDLRDIRIPLQGHFANADTWCKPEHVDVLENALRLAGGEHEIYRYDADHGFCNEEIVGYRADLAELAWQRSLGHWRKHLGS